MTAPDTCTWTENDGFWETGCDDSFHFEDYTPPTPNNFRFCPFCGKPLIEHPETPA